MNDPINAIEWRDAATLNSNDYNPNIVFTPELRLLERSLILTGWIQPILITTDGTIIDGFHRSRLALQSEPLKKRYGGKVPCAVIDVPRDQAMMLTIRMNRAKGSHVAVKMSDIVRELIDVHACDPQEVAIEIGATKDEIDLLYQDGVFKMKRIDEHAYSKAWYPEEREEHRVRFNSPEHLETWRLTGRFPKIHDACANMAVANVRGHRLLDLGCGFGLLGARIVVEAGLELGVGVDSDETAIAAGEEVGLPLIFRHLVVNASSLPALMLIFVDVQVDVLIARRVLPELFGHDLPAGKVFADMLAGLGVKEIVLEGRVDSAASVNPLHSVDQEIDLVSGYYREVRRTGAVSYLVLR